MAFKFAAQASKLKITATDKDSGLSCRQNRQARFVLKLACRMLTLQPTSP